MESWISMPKIELHAHLNGSIRDSTLLELARDLGEKGVIVFADVEHVILKNDRSLCEVFKLFDLIHILTTDHATVTRITKEVVEDFASDNVVYLELRTTPKKNDLIGMSKRSYMEAVLEGLRAVSAVDIDFAPKNMDTTSPMTAITKSNACNGTIKKKIYVRLLLSIDRRETTAAAMDTVKLALEMRRLGVVGIDLSGNPNVGEWTTFLPALEFAQQQGLQVTLHCGEVPNRKEIQAMLDFLPQRIGHACFFEEEDWIKLKSSKIPVEICLTSNIRTESISSIDIHHFADLYNTKHPSVLCTDDSGVFSTSLSEEYKLAASTFGLGKKEMFELVKNAIEFIFADVEVKQDLKEIFNLAAKKWDL
ncbi:adenosine/AMP deaminase family protein [Tripterygium wilfordii]|uniref:Adenosine/AMP deaminase family protein n=1 Tax=Tripterygium wilfordii TaxID=458696 RepID=A0A7J7C3T5_TRIWF|nr:N6-mAMP deaminase [Tripterygium wilfordii]KAF5728595.1 adenosine/AMP deaminase family protein [Tripterygium wilfordii]